MAKYKAYPEYKDSGVESLDTIPKMWSIKKLKYIFEIKKRIAGKIGFDVLSVTQKGIKIKDIESGEGQLSMDYSKYQRVYPGEFAMNHMDLLTGYVDISNYDGVTSPDYRVFAVRDKHSFYSRYYLYLLQDGYKQRRFFHLGQGSAHLGRWRLPTEAFNEIVYPCPSLTEQIHIASFLDHETAKIDDLIEKQQQLIELLKEKRQAVISHAVTKGLNSDVPMKDSGVEWLGDVPEHWDVSYLKYVIANEKNAMVDGPFGSSVNTETDYVEQGIPVIRTVNITNLGFSSENLKFMRYEKYIQLKRHSVRPNDVLFSKVGTIGNACILPDSIPEAILSTTGSCKITLEQGSVIPEYLVYVIQSMNEHLMQIANSNVQPFLNMSNIRGLNIPLPKLDEQKDILQAININLLKIDDLIDKASKFELLLQERRTALISAAVTGKIDVRDWVATDTQDVEEPQEATA
ncbi:MULTISPECIES: restriction endonuclease subunit S [Enterobacter]|uniref:restriction endonuclease subunit S n=1 Tax=Enterobacter TaxID=547 RepID=UPI0003D8FC77|nr:MULTISPECIES: restriction endonuclease subunit S [Enterobacter cloacae complex]AHE73470.1 hypothetical protein M942_23265 [Enterobacter ludwigii]MRG32701.1 restriction endonuclease subunit S [Enterobacter cancerogenus]QZY37459.1 restriction endonuclease subunit S [Enterobacter cancerogenus]